MLAIDTLLAAKSKDLENLSWHEITSQMGLLSFNSQGYKPMELIATLARITDSSTVLIAGCGAGGTTMHPAEMTHATVHGIDLSPASIQTAKVAASKSSARDKLHFLVGNASALSFAPDSLDAVITEYSAFFLQPSAFTGFFSVLKSGGYVALAEMVKDPEVNKRAAVKIAAAEKTYSGLLEYRFHIPLVTEYVDWLTQAGFENVRIHERSFLLLRETLAC
jgi:ubiquinone/menaquinone biosynthesis C-methylase UbiE